MNQNPNTRSFVNCTTFRIVTKGYAAGIIVCNDTGIILQAAPILQHYVGLHWHKVRYQLQKRNADITNISGGLDNDVPGS